ncbi:MAG TPA: hypothetical protein VL486_08395 [Verrucomicrobiae bacterium]|nr:hypothetical protein [Verrucomicrobiae bacterium]
MKRWLHRLSLLLLILSLISSGFFVFKVRERNQLLDRLIDDVVTGRNLKDRSEIVISLAQEIYQRTNRPLRKDEVDWYTRVMGSSFFYISAAGSLKYGGYGFVGGIGASCGAMSRTLLNVLWRLKIPARKLQLVGTDLGRSGAHTMIEFYYHGAWRVCSPSDNGFVWRAEDGEIATVNQIHNNPAIFSQIYASEPDFPYHFDHPTNIRWGKLPDWMISTIRFVIGERRFESMKTPELYDQPRQLFLDCSVSLSILFLALSFITRSKRRPARGHTSPALADQAAPKA